MEDDSIKIFTEKRLELGGAKQLTEWTKAIDKHILTGESEYFYIPNHEALRDFVSLIGHSAVTCEQIIAYYYSATAHERLEVDGESMSFEGSATIVGLQERLGDVGVSLEHPNDFRVNLAVAVDAETMILYQHQMSAEPNVCKDCADSTDPDIIEELALNEGSHGCGHADDTYYSNNSATIMKRMNSSDALANMYHLF